MDGPQTADTVASLRCSTRPTGRQVACPTLLLESAHDDLDIHGDPAEIWAPWLARPLRHRIIDSGHHQAKEAPGPVADALLDFLTPGPA